VLARGVPVKNENGEILCWAGINLDISRLKQTEQALWEAHERLQRILGSISDGFMSLDRQWRVTFVNERGAHDVGQTRESMLGRVLWEIFPEAVGSEFERAYLQAMNEHVTTTAESYYPPLKAWFEACAYPSEDGISVFFRDVTDRKTVEQNLREVQADLNRAQAVGQIGSWRLDVKRNELLWSDENHRIFGVPQGTPLTYETFLAIVYPQDREYVDRKWRASLRGEPYDIEHRIMAGETVKWVRERAELEFDPQGELKGGFGTTQDITARKQTEAKLKQSEEALRRTNEQLEAMVRKRTVELENTVATLQLEIAARKKIQAQLHQLSRVFMDAADPIIIEDLSGIIVDMNRAAETAYEWSREELIGKSITTLFVPERLELAMQLRDRCRRGEEVRNWEGLRRVKSGRVIQSLLTGFPLTDESGGVAFIATICKDISARKEMEARLQASELQLKELTRKSLQALEADRRTVARELHDSVGGSLSAIKFGLEEKVEQTADTGTCSPDALATIASDLADVIKETKRISANLRPLMIDDLGLLTTIEWYARQCQERFGSIRIHCQFAVEEREIPEDLKIVVYRVIQEAVTNAARHSRAETVWVSFSRQDDRFSLEIRDHGSGFDISAALEQKDPMTGHGLLSMKQRVEISGGSFSISSQAGEGTSVRASFPNANQL
jgi:PAS domain S-box-containing protein